MSGSTLNGNLCGLSGHHSARPFCLTQPTGTSSQRFENRRYPLNSISVTRVRQAFQPDSLRLNPAHVPCIAGNDRRDGEKRTAAVSAWKG